MFANIPNVKLGILAVSRDCFPITLSEKRRKAIVAKLKEKAQKLVIGCAYKEETQLGPVVSAKHKKS